MNVLIIFPHNNALNPCSGVETRTWNIISSLVKNNFQISVLHSINSKGYEDKELKKKVQIFYYKDLFLFGISDWYLTDFNPFFILKLFKIIRQQKIDIILVEFPWGLLTTKLISRKNSIVIFDSAGIETEFIKIAVDHPTFPKYLKHLIQVYIKYHEKLVCKRADLIINVSDLDRNYYVENFNIKKSKTLIIQTPSALEFDDLSRNDDLKVKSRKKLGLPANKTIIIFHGGLPHPPNREAFDLIIDYIAPNINNSDILFVLAGNRLEKFKKDNVISIGFVESLRDLLIAADFAIVPIISGSGMRVKCVDYIMASLPFIITKKGIEGLNFLIPGKDYILCDDVDSTFLEKIKQLTNDKKLREEIHNNLIKSSEKISRNKFENKFINLLLKLNNIKKNARRKYNSKNQKNIQ